MNLASITVKYDSLAPCVHSNSQMVVSAEKEDTIFAPLFRKERFTTRIRQTIHIWKCTRFAFALAKISSLRNANVTEELL